MFTEMMKAARNWLLGRDPMEIAEEAGVSFDGTAFRFESLGRTVMVTYPEYTVVPQLEEWWTMVILHYLKLADGTPLTGKPISFAQQRDGMVRGGGFDRTVEMQVQTYWGTLPIEELERKCGALGGRILKSNADLCAEFPFLPRYPVTLKLWLADDEFPASGRLLLDSSAEHYLTIEDSVTVGNILLQKLEQS